MYNETQSFLSGFIEDSILPWCDISLVSLNKRSWTLQNLKLKTPHSSEISVCANPVHDAKSQMIWKFTMCYLIVIFDIRITSIGSLRGKICINKNFKKCNYFKHREENQLDSTECFIALIIYSTCFGHLYAHHQELDTILVLLPHMVCNALFAGGRLLRAEQQAICQGWGKLCTISLILDA